jgi:hypothetical protein
MADIAVLDIKVANLEEKCEETHGIVRGIENEVGELSDRTYRIEIWKDGNGARGAEMRLQDVENILTSVKSCIDKVSSDENIAHIAQIAAKGVVDNARTKDRTVVSKVKAFAPYFAAACALIAGIVAVIVK